MSAFSRQCWGSFVYSEWAYGVADWFEAGAYVPIYSYTSSGQLLFEGIKLRTLFVVSHAADRIFFYGVNFASVSG